MRIPLIVIALISAFGSAAQARFARVPAERVNEIPVERLLANIERNRQGLDQAQKARAIGRLHLLAYLRQSEKLMAYRDRPGELAEGKIGDCAALDRQTYAGFGAREFPRTKPGELCEQRTYELGPRPEVPNTPYKPSANGHLIAAIAAYEQARGLEPQNLRTRVALAFAYGCAGRREKARNELRFVVRRGLELVPQPVSATTEPERTYPVAPPQRVDWETHVVLSEGVVHFAAIVTRDDDRRLISTLWDRLKSSPPARYVTPILVPLIATDNVDTLIDRTSDAAFDFSGQGAKMRLGWLSDKAAWLIWDPRGTGKIESGFQLFGSVTWIAFWENGYLPLGALDDNGDGKISGDELKGLALWRDANNNGISEDGEVKPLADYGIVALGYVYERQGDDMWVSVDGVTFADGEVRPSYDWRLHEAQVKTVSQ